MLLPGGREVPLTLRRSRRARHIGLTVSPVDGQVTLVLPEGAAQADGLAFVARKLRWIEARRAAAPGRVPFAEGVVLTVLGEALHIRRAPAGGRAARRAGGALLVPAAAADDLAGCVTAWLRRSAREAIEPRAAEKAARLGRGFRAITVRDTRTRWGSCSAQGRLGFSWRLVLAPVPVLDYVVAHEVAHLAEMNHGPRFWAHVEALCPGADRARAWLRANGAALHRYG